MAEPTPDQVARADQNVMWTRALLAKMVEDARELRRTRDGLTLFVDVGERACEILAMAEVESEDGDALPAATALLTAAVIQLAETADG